MAYIKVSDFLEKYQQRPLALLQGCCLRVPRSLLEAGCRFIDGRGVQRSLSKAVRLLRESEKLGEPIASALLGVLELEYPEECGVRPRSTVIRRLREASVAGITAAAKQYVAIALRCGSQKDRKDAYSLIKRSAERGESWACYELGVLLLEGGETSRSRKNAAMYFRRSASEGDVDAMVNLSLMILMDESPEEVENEAWRLLSLAYERGSGVAAYEMALMILNSQSPLLPMNPDTSSESQKVRYLLEFASRQSVSRAQQLLAKHLCDDNHTKYRLRIESLLSYAAIQGEKDALFDLQTNSINSRSRSKRSLTEWHAIGGLRSPLWWA